MDALEEQRHIQNYVDLVLNGTLIDKDKIYSPSNNPLISIVISVYNGEAYLKTALISIQNQDLKNIEIIMVDDGSKDNSINLIKELMKTEPRIILLENGENRGPLYTKTKGVMHAKGKYVMTLDEDDIYCQRNAFSSLFNIFNI
jgi:glycosyltransferase involved in cell wall biosynthesis